MFAFARYAIMPLQRSPFLFRAFGCLRRHDAIACYATLFSLRDYARHALLIYMRAAADYFAIAITPLRSAIHYATLPSPPLTPFSREPF